MISSYWPVLLMGHAIAQIVTCSHKILCPTQSNMDHPGGLSGKRGGLSPSTDFRSQSSFDRCSIWIYREWFSCHILCTAPDTEALSHTELSCTGNLESIFTLQFNLISSKSVEVPTISFCERFATSGMCSQL